MIHGQGIDVPIVGAGVPVFGRRWGFWWGTGAAGERRSPIRGAGPHPFSSPAPRMGTTCTKNRPYLRQHGCRKTSAKEVRRHWAHFSLHNSLIIILLTKERCTAGCTSLYVSRSESYSWLRRQAKYSSRTLRAASEGTGAAWQPAPVRTIVCGALFTKRGHSGRPGPFGSPVLAKLVQ